MLSSLNTLCYVIMKSIAELTFQTLKYGQAVLGVLLIVNCALALRMCLHHDRTDILDLLTIYLRFVKQKILIVMI